MNIPKFLEKITRTNKTSVEKSSIDVGKVMALHNAKWSQAKIADEMGCSQGRISQIIKEYKQ